MDKENQGLPWNTPKQGRGEPEIHNGAFKRATTQRVTVFETKTVHSEPYVEKLTTTTPQEGYGTRRHRHRWGRNTKLSPRKTFTP
jgi:hypothetical protein